MNTCHFSPDRKYRYTLSHVIDGQITQECVFIGLNPSTADEQQEDPTIRRCIGFAQYWGYNTVTMMNIFAYRSTNPKKLYSPLIDPIGSENDAYLITFCQRADIVIAAWGNHGELHGRGTAVKRLFKDYGIPLHHLGFTKLGHPRHPLYLKADLKPSVWPL